MVDSNTGWPSGRPRRSSNLTDVFNAASYGHGNVRLVILSKENTIDPESERSWLKALSQLKQPLPEDEIPAAAPKRKSRKKAVEQDEGPMFKDGSLLDGSTKWKMPKKSFGEAASGVDELAIDTTGMKRGEPTDLKGALGMPRIKLSGPGSDFMG